MESNENVKSHTVAHRQIRALYDDQTITVYQAYPASIALPAVRQQKLSASPDFSLERMTWIKPSWCWIMYRAGYSFKDERQAHILALRMKHEHFRHLLSLAVVNDRSGDRSVKGMDQPVRVQWDPERTPQLDALPYRSIQIGIPRDLSGKWVEGWIESIEDVTERAKELKSAVEADPAVTRDELVRRGLVPDERVYEVSEELQRILKMVG